MKKLPVEYIRIDIDRNGTRVFIRRIFNFKVYNDVTKSSALRLLDALRSMKIPS